MKLASLDDGTRDGQLAVVSRDLSTAHIADGIAPSLRAALDDWAFIAPQLDALYRQLNDGKGDAKARRAFDFDPAQCMAPLPRASSRVCGATYLHHHDLEQRALGRSVPAAWRDAPQLQQVAGDGLLGPTQHLVLAREEWGIDFGAELAIVSGDLRQGATPDAALGQIRLLLLANAITLRNLVPDALAAGFGLLQAKPVTAFAPVAVTPDELGDAWTAAKAALPLRVRVNGNPVGTLEAGEDMTFNFAQLLSALAMTRPVTAGTIVSAGVVSNRATRRHTPGYASIAEARWLEMANGSEALTPFMRFGDTVHIDMLDGHGKSLFGAIEQTLKAATA
ncbi:fumarylacetoacetate hydrolase family protein [Oxalobacteraceae sp. CFBP 13730]|nr:fumarylacetoacetate hydrolase family protein [Oxalobacteraceae sp. CFBP 13730]